MNVDDEAGETLASHGFSLRSEKGFDASTPRRALTASIVAEASMLPVDSDEPGILAVTNASDRIEFMFSWNLLSVSILTMDARNS